MVSTVQVVVAFEVVGDEDDIDLVDLEACIEEGVDDFMMGNPNLQTSGVAIQSDIVETGEE